MPLAKLNAYAEQTNRALERALPQEQSPQAEVLRAARYSLLAGGKRLRPALLLEFYAQCGGRSACALDFACAVEMIHTYSLIHDDLPCMDDDDMRRGRPTCHRAFSEAMAVLAGDALLNRAFEHMLASDAAPADVIVRTARCIAEAAGVHGMVGGQAIDITAGDDLTGDDLTGDGLDTLVRLKTGALIRAACVGGCLLACAPPELTDAAGRYADSFALAFQITDDILDAAGDPGVVGKTLGRDAANDRRTFLSAYGLERCRAIVQDLTEAACRAADAFPDPSFLTALALWQARRDH